METRSPGSAVLKLPSRGSEQLEGRRLLPSALCSSRSLMSPTRKDRQQERRKRRASLRDAPETACSMVLILSQKKPELNNSSEIFPFWVSVKHVKSPHEGEEVKTRTLHLLLTAQLLQP